MVGWVVGKAAQRPVKIREWAFSEDGWAWFIDAGRSQGLFSPRNLPLGGRRRCYVVGSMYSPVFLKIGKILNFETHLGPRLWIRESGLLLNWASELD